MPVASKSGNNRCGLSIHIYHHDPKATAPSSIALLYAPGSPRPSDRLGKPRQERRKSQNSKKLQKLELPQND